MEDYTGLISRCEGYARPLFMLNDRALNGGEDINFKLVIDPDAGFATAQLTIRGADHSFSVSWDRDERLEAQLIRSYLPRFEADVKDMILKCVFMVMQKGAFAMLEGNSK